MNIVFRADSSINIGSGHIMRCLTLADLLASRGHQCYFICRKHQGNLIDVIQAKGYTVFCLTLSNQTIAENSVGKLYHSDWLGTTQEEDVKESIEQLQQNNVIPDWIVVDHYALDEDWEIQLNQTYPNTSILVIDDLADRKHQCDLLLDQNLDADASKYFHQVNPIRTQALLGVGYALLRPEFAKYRNFSLKRREEPLLKEILINLGGIDKDNLTSRILFELTKANLANDVHITVVMGKTAPHIESVKKLANAYSTLNIDVVVNATDMAERMANADLAIGAAGSASWERCCLGLPTLLLVLAENQKKVAKILDSSNIAEVVEVNQIAKKIENLTACRLKEMSYNAKKLIDGNGALRVVSKMEQK
ncbi:UDP-2,4-diacetamido-2,4,6-trideoxy-beta-L-altropyranose hydrolase [Rodentibacter trehalosifermentans]|uniref:UDP-2,4-diacetamido-2,4, 6-trideoxy-beta-L-altropyranose hydrolase n=1 Tax=Rodentibacter trehalosifermentans TaxID=1908263 RepID=A0A1V3IUA0_9PAST|nr:UDP-2,4-diacetamido-2,4,6-trideoxy-beta-L-altropyranose hydrolase [Rodentibacter trehalosifermentans]OOF45499.1 UDP-2,4-diacetamido-2,4,6-trideoxy-beta-L-altropyranose hydrolase [Rodentibacter trehalosifermentans]